MATRVYLNKKLKIKIKNKKKMQQGVAHFGGAQPPPVAWEWLSGHPFKIQGWPDGHPRPLGGASPFFFFFFFKNVFLFIF